MTILTICMQLLLTLEGREFALQSTVERRLSELHLTEHIG